MQTVTKIAIFSSDKALRGDFVAARCDSMALVHSASDYCDAVENIERLDIDVALIDTDIEALAALACIRDLRRKSPQLKIIAFSGRSDPASVFDTLSAGAEGYLLKPISMDTCSSAVDEILAGGAPMSAQIARLVVKSFFSADPEPEKLGLSRRELDVLSALAEGLPYKQIADELKMGMGTVRTHIRHLYKKLGVHSRTEAVVMFLGRGRPQSL
ncbi:MAG: DNA-binding NarL/FixJ family response regulator [Verrucomicrobiales bacterium]|jgi:DNA-binding NarL/FixJ family response regulator